MLIIGAIVIIISIPILSFNILLYAVYPEVGGSNDPTLEFNARWCRFFCGSPWVDPSIDKIERKGDDLKISSTLYLNCATEKIIGKYEIKNDEDLFRL